MITMPSSYSRIPIPAPPGSLGDTLAPNQDGILANLNAVATSIKQIIQALKSLDSADANIITIINKLELRVKELEDEMAYVLALTGGTINAAWYAIDSDGEGPFSAATIIAAAASITGEPKTLLLKSGTWVIDANVDLSATGSTLLLAPGAVLEQVGAFTFKMPLNVTIPDQGFHFDGATGFIVPKAASKITLDPRWWGALETSDSTAALIAFEQASYSQGVNNKVLPAGNYGFSGTWEIRQGLAGVGVTITQLDPTVQTNVRSATVYSTLIDNIRITGDITIESIYSRPSLTLISCHGFYVEGVKALHSNDMGFYSSLSNGAKFKKCSSSFVKYAVVPSTGAAADGYYHTGCVDMQYEDCYAYDFRRIGFTSEGSASVKSKNVIYLRCIAEYANNQQDSTTEYNGGIWVERTNGATMRDCIMKNIASGVGQATKHPRAYTVGSGFTENSAFLIDNCRAIENAFPNDLLGAQLYGQGGMGDIIVTSLYVDSGYQGVVVGGGMHSVQIRDLCVNSFAGNANCAAVIVTADLASLSIDGIVETNCTWDANGGTVLFFANALSCDYTLRNAKGITHAMLGSGGVVKSISVSDCSILFGCTSRPGFSSLSMLFTNVDFTERATGNASIAQYTGSDATNLTSLVGCRLSFVPGNRWQVLGMAANIQMTGCTIYGGRVRMIGGATTVSCLFEGNRFEHQSWAAIEYFTGTQAGIARFIGNHFIGTVIPIPEGPLPTRSSPANSIMTGNFYSAASGALTNYTAAVSSNNNVAY